MKAEYRAIVTVFNGEIEEVAESQYKWENPELNEGMFYEVLNECIKKINAVEEGLLVSGQIAYFDINGRYNLICRMYGKATICRNEITIQTDEKTITIPV